jgi:predicted  nucleic acid-binding Zn-ribbon protein
MIVVEDMKKERAALRTKLDRYQKDFFKIHNRKIKYRNDIKEVADEFKRYKDLKEEIQALETKVRT